MKTNYNFTVGDVLEGVISKILPYGVIVTLDNNVQGLVHISHLHNKFVNNVSDLFNLQDIVKVKVLTIDNDNNKIALSIKDVSPQTSNDVKPIFNKQPQSIPQSTPVEKSHFETIMSNWQKESNDKIESINRRTKRRS